MYGFFMAHGLPMLLVWLPLAGTFHLHANVGDPKRSTGCLCVAPNRCSVAEAQGLHAEIRNGHHDGCPCDGIKAASQLSETLISVGPVVGTNGRWGRALSGACSSTIDHRGIVITGSRAGTQSEETLYVQGTKARDHLFALELRPSSAFMGPGAIRCSRAMPTEEPISQSSPRRLPFPRFRPISTHRLPLLVSSHHRRHVNDALVPITRRPPQPAFLPWPFVPSPRAARQTIIWPPDNHRGYTAFDLAAAADYFSPPFSLSFNHRLLRSPPPTFFDHHHSNSNRRFALRSHDHRRDHPVKESARDPLRQSQCKSLSFFSFLSLSLPPPPPARRRRRH